MLRQPDMDLEDYGSEAEKKIAQLSAQDEQVVQTEDEYQLQGMQLHLQTFTICPSFLREQVSDLASTW